MNKQILISATIVCTSMLTTGCSTMALNEEVSSFERQTQPVMTEYSTALQCLGDLIDESGQPNLTIYVDDIEDTTVPFRFRDRRLSKGGAWWFHTAINKMQSPKVSSVLRKPNRDFAANNNVMHLTGAWTQDDTEIGVNDRAFGLSNLGGGYLSRLGFFSRNEVSVIAGDFVSTINGKVAHASAISLAVDQSDTNYELRIDDGSRRFDLGLENDVNEGPQFAQRRIAEAAALVHVANAFALDYSSCIVEVPETEENRFSFISVP